MQPCISTDGLLLQSLGTWQHAHLSYAGGLGSLGALVARWAAANPGAHVWLLSRSAHASRGRPLGLPADSPAQVQCGCWAASVPSTDAVLP
jgi:hypothetical protein